ncbi:MAG: Carboxypeptidase regulatory-like domain, partial [Blastocatellia bacterium]|nr:Carboxypeptidase regulatory-like domain [Blastocatellia bacterium]
MRTHSKQNNPTLFGIIRLIAAPGKHAHVFRGLLFTLVLGCLCALPGTASAQALVQTTGAVTTSAQLTLTANYAGTPVNGHVLVAVVATRSTETTVTLSSPGATNPAWTEVGGSDFAGLAPGHGIFYRVTGAVETTNVTVTVVPTATLIAMQIYEFSGVDTANPLYNFNSNFGAANPLLTDDILPNRTPYLAVATFGINTSSNAGNFTAFTNTGTNTQAWIQQADQKAGAGGTPRVTLVGGYKVPVTTGTVGASTTWSQANIETWKGQIAVFNASGPAAANGSVSGLITDGEGHAVEGAVVSLSGTENRKTITNAKGFYQFDNVETSGFYNVSASRANYTFSPASRSFSALGSHTDAGFTGSSTGDSANPLDTAEY